MRFFIWMVMEEVVQDQVVSEESSMYCFDMESEERMKSEMKLSVNDVIGEKMGLGSLQERNILIPGIDRRRI